MILKEMRSRDIREKMETEVKLIFIFFGFFIIIFFWVCCLYCIVMILSLFIFLLCNFDNY